MISTRMCGPMRGSHQVDRLGEELTGDPEYFGTENSDGQLIIGF